MEDELQIVVFNNTCPKCGCGNLILHPKFYLFKLGGDPSLKIYFEYICNGCKETIDREISKENYRK